MQEINEEVLHTYNKLDFSTLIRVDVETSDKIFNEDDFSDEEEYIFESNEEFELLKISKTYTLVTEFFEDYMFVTGKVKFIDINQRRVIFKVNHISSFVIPHDFKINVFSDLKKFRRRNKIENILSNI